MAPLHADLFEMAAAYLFHIVANHPFVDGNKRVGLEAALVFLEIAVVLRTRKVRGGCVRTALSWSIIALSASWRGPRADRKGPALLDVSLGTRATRKYARPPWLKNRRGQERIINAEAQRRGGVNKRATRLKSSRKIDSPRLSRMTRASSTEVPRGMCGVAS
jgi:hypothetical protein